MKRHEEEEKTRNEANRSEAKLTENKWHVDQRDTTWWRVISRHWERSRERKEQVEWRQGKWCHLKKEVKFNGKEARDIDQRRVKKEKSNEMKRDDSKLCHMNQREKWGEVTSKEEKCSGMKGCKDEWTKLGRKWGDVKNEVELKEEWIWTEAISI